MAGCNKPKRKRRPVCRPKKQYCRCPSGRKTCKLPVRGCKARKRLPKGFPSYCSKYIGTTPLAPVIQPVQVPKPPVILRPIAVPSAPPQPPVIIMPRKMSRPSARPVGLAVPAPPALLVPPVPVPMVPPAPPKLKPIPPRKMKTPSAPPGLFVIPELKPIPPRKMVEPSAPPQQRYPLRKTRQREQRVEQMESKYSPDRRIINTKLKPIPYPWFQYLNFLVAPKNIVTPLSLEWGVIDNNAIKALDDYPELKKSFKFDARKMPIQIRSDIVRSKPMTLINKQTGISFDIEIYDGKSVQKWVQGVFDKTKMPFLNAQSLAFIREDANRTPGKYTSRLITQSLRKGQLVDIILDNIDIISNAIAEQSLKEQIKRKQINIIPKDFPNEIDPFAILLKLYNHWFRPVSLVTNGGQTVHAYSSTGFQVLLHGLKNNAPSFTDDWNYLQKLLKGFKV